jgi:hypothetical protein
MTDRDALKAAMHPALHDLDVRIKGLDVGDCHCNLVAEVILDAILPALEEGMTVEWSPRYAHDGSSAFASTFTEAGARQWVAEASYLALFSRHCGPWERVD